MTTENVTLWVRVKGKAGAKIEQINKKLLRLGNNGLRTAARWAKRFGIAMIAGVVVTLGAAIRAASKFEDKMFEVGTLIGGPSVRGQIKKFGDAVLEMSLRLPKTAEDLGAGLYQVLSAGITDAADALFVLETSGRAAVAGLTDTLTSVDAVTTVLNAYGLQAGEATRITDVFFETIKQGKTTFPELARRIGLIAPTAALAGVSMEELGGAIAAFTKAGVSTRIGITGLNALLLRILNPSAKAAAAAKELGIEWNESGLKARGFQGLMEDLAKATGGNATKLGQVVPELEAFRVVAILAGTGAAEFKTQVENMNNSAGAAHEAFILMNSSLSSQWTLIKNKLNVVLIEAGSKIIPELSRSLFKAAGPLAQLREIIRENDVAIQQFGTSIGQIGSGIVIAITWLGKLTIAFGDLLDTVQKIMDPSEIFAEPIRNTIEGLDSAEEIRAERERLLARRNEQNETREAAIKARDAKKTELGLDKPLSTFDQVFDFGNKTTSRFIAQQELLPFEQRVADAGAELAGIDTGISFAEARIRLLETGSSLERANELVLGLKPEVGGGGVLSDAELQRILDLHAAALGKGQEGLGVFAGSGFTKFDEDSPPPSNIGIGTRRFGETGDGEIGIGGLGETELSILNAQASALAEEGAKIRAVFGGEESGFGDTFLHQLKGIFGQLTSETTNFEALLADIAAGGFMEFVNSWEDAVGSVVDGSKTMGQAISGAIKGAFAAAAKTAARFYLAKATAALGEGFLGDPKGFVAAAKFFAAATAFSAVGALASGGGGGAGGGGGTSPDAVDDAANDPFDGRRAKFVIRGKFRPNDPAFLDDLEEGLRARGLNRQVEFILED